MEERTFAPSGGGACRGLGILAVEIAGRMPFAQLFVFFTPGLVDDAPTAHGWSFGDLLYPPLDMGVLMDREEFARFAVNAASDKGGQPRPACNVRDRVVLAAKIFALGQPLVGNC